MKKPNVMKAKATLTLVRVQKFPYGVGPWQGAKLGTPPRSLNVVTAAPAHPALNVRIAISCNPQTIKGNSRSVQYGTLMQTLYSTVLHCTVLLVLQGHTMWRAP